MSASISEKPPLIGGMVLTAIVVLMVIAITEGSPPDGLRLFRSAPTPHVATNPVVLSDGRQIHVQTHEVTIVEWNRCHAAGGCSLKLKRRKTAKSDYPATGLNWFDVNEYLEWINHVHPATFRLPTAKEWDEIAREVLPEKPDPLFTDPELRWASSYLTAPSTSRKLRPTGSFKTTQDGITDLNGSVWEWTSDCYASAEKGFDESNCPAYFVGGEHIAAIPVFTRDPARGGCAVGSPPPHLGLRLVSDNPV